MASSMTNPCFFIVALFLLSVTTAYGQLSQNFYAGTCPALDGIIQREVSRALSAEKRMGASLLRLFFHDCFVQGCDASILLDDAPGTLFVGEKTASPNVNSVRGYDVIDNIKAAVEANCSAVVSCADIIALATRQAVVQLGGPSWTLLLGRRDSTTASKAQAESDLPGPGFNLSALIGAFGKKGLTPNELVALSGAHTIGKARCAFADDGQEGRAGCPPLPLPLLQLSSDMTALDLQTPDAFDNKYYENLVKKKGLLHSDNVLVTDSTLNSLVHKYSTKPGIFADDFAAAMERLSKIGVLTGGEGQIRLHCKKVNN
ncbi:hypothetical protein PR202_gb06701 [Eleusine coracana subsp. coracana]|uniref:Peroxidase n=1 Tax=Eleusine coracana subsp. coracana TaxID=191504 RepID=A0AAV5E7T8_ELECO|nr:hypothetical protein QOZ80_2BG0161100 [Eleusine coracana subsp. coracana]GJN19423.1 hypothetical protein PR202_gb06701 [Eleusine coracana subsp. coracana]